MADAGGQDVEHRGERVPVGPAGGDGDVRSIAEDPVDQPGARAARPHLDEQADAVGVGVLDRPGEVDHLRRLRSDRPRCGPAIDRVSAAGNTAVEGDPRRRRGVDIVQGFVLGLDEPADLAMHGADGRELEQRAT